MLVWRPAHVVSMSSMISSRSLVSCPCLSCSSVVVMCPFVGWLFRLFRILNYLAPVRANLAHVAVKEAARVLRRPFGEGENLLVALLRDPQRGLLPRVE